jgi:hypothetical protein
MQRPPRPEPTQISPYFFEQLHSRFHGITTTTTDNNTAAEKEGQTDGQGDALCDTATAVTSTSKVRSITCTAAAAAEQMHASANLAGLFDESNASRPHRDGAGTPAPIFPARPQQHDLQQVLWTAFTPVSYTAAFTTFVMAESDVTERLRQAVADAWTSVEGVMARNAHRRACLDSLTRDDATWRAEVRARLYWQSSDIVSRYGLEVGGLSDASPPTPAAGESNDAAAAAAGVPASAAKGGSSSSRCSGNSSAGDEDDEHIVLDFSVLKEGQSGSPLSRALRRASGGGRGGNAAESGEGASSDEADSDGESSGAAAAAAVVGPTPLPRAKAWTTSTKELLDPCARPHPLRRLFAPLQRDRATLPKWTTLLLNDAHAVQQGKLPLLEEGLQSCVLFKIPLHRPFLAARAALQECATQKRSAPEVEAGQVTAYRQVEQLAKRVAAFVKGQQQQQQTPRAGAEGNGVAGGTAPSSLASPGNGTPVSRGDAAGTEDDVVEDVGERWATAETLWTMLLTELDACKRFLADAVPRCSELHCAVSREAGAVQAALVQQRASCEAMLSHMKAEARTCAEVLTRNGQRTLAAVAEMEERYTPDQARLVSAIARRKAELRQLEAQQEKNVRRVREALKACFVDQIKYEEASQALLQDQLTLAQLEASHHQLRQAVQVRHEGALMSEKHAAQLSQLLEDADAVAHDFFVACDAHTRRMTDEDYFIQCRLLDQCTQVLQQRCRCLHAIAALYDQRYATLEARAGGSWQLQFLLSGERDWAVQNLADVRAEFAALERDWETVRAMRCEMEMDPVELDSLVKTAEWAEVRATVLRLDAPAALQRRLPTLRAHSEALTRPAAGCGSQAVRRLLTS